MKSAKNGSARLVAASLAAAVCLWPMVGWAQDAQPPSGSALTVEQAVDAFTGGGYQIDQPLSWDWMSPPVTTFQVSDTAKGRVLMVLVYPTAEAAEIGRSQALAHEAELYPASGALRGYGPHLVDGYGQSMWRGNVALVQTSQAALNHGLRVQNDRESNLYVGTIDVDQSDIAPSVAVDLDFQQALQVAVNL